MLAAFDRHQAVVEASSFDLPRSQILAQAQRALAKECAVFYSDDEHTQFGYSVPQWPAFADAPAVLQYFRRYFKIVAFVIGDPHSFAASARRLETTFDLIYTAEEIGSSTLDQRGIGHVISKLAKLGYVARQTPHIGASAQRDFAPAAAAGLATAWGRSLLGRRSHR